MWTDTHAHLDVFAQLGELPEVLARALDHGVTHILAVGGTPEANAIAVVCAETSNGRIAAAVGYDRELAGRTDLDFEWLRERLRDGRAIAVGEIGLDYHRGHAGATMQKALFERGLVLAAETGRPVVVHSRAAERDTVDMLRMYVRMRSGREAAPGVVHCFTGDWEFARKLLDLGFHLGISGIVTFANAHGLREVIRRVPADRVLLETDCPYLAPQPVRGRRNEPAYLRHTGEFVAHWLGWSADEWAHRTTANASQLFGWPPLSPVTTLGPGLGSAGSTGV